MLVYQLHQKGTALTGLSSLYWETAKSPSGALGVRWESQARAHHDPPSLLAQARKQAILVQHCAAKYSRKTASWVKDESPAVGRLFEWFFCNGGCFPAHPVTPSIASASC
ncbi:hypothetical protein NQZ68_036399 [Dissostichus eleginoides]|nr:hypothetical protein NQZ68_036399 [Dissostichus eleginoides]